MEITIQSPTRPSTISEPYCWWLVIEAGNGIAQLLLAMPAWCMTCTDDNHIANIMHEIADFVCDDDQCCRDMYWLSSTGAVQRRFENAGMSEIAESYYVHNDLQDREWTKMLEAELGFSRRPEALHPSEIGGCLTSCDQCSGCS